MTDKALEPVERVARALCIVSGQDPDSLDPCAICDSENRALPLWQAFKDEARAALEAMRPETDTLNVKGLVERLREKMKRAEPLPWAWEQCGEKQDCPVVGVIFEGGEETPLAGRVSDFDVDGNERVLDRWNIALEWGSGIDASAPSANADFVVEAVNSLPTLLTALEQLQAEVERLREGLTRIRDRCVALRKGTDDWFDLVEIEAVCLPLLQPKEQQL